MDEVYMMKMLESLGITQEQLGPEKMELLMKLSENVSEPEKMTTSDSLDILSKIGLSLEKRKIPKELLHQKLRDKKIERYKK